MDIITHILSPEFFKGLSAVGVLLLVFVALTVEKGPLRLTREFRPVRDENENLRKLASEQSQQITTLANEIKTLNAVLSGIRQVAEDKK